MVFNKKRKLNLKDTKDNETILLKIVKVTKIKGGKTQVGFHDGRTMVSEEKYKAGDTVVFDLTKKKVKNIIPMERNSKAYLYGGKHTGEMVTIKEIPQKGSLGKARVVVNSEGKDFVTLKEYVFVTEGDDLVQ